MLNLNNNIRVLLLRLSIPVLVYSLCRLLFFALNFSAYSNVTASSVIFDFITGLRFDIASVILTNIVFIFFHLIPFNFRLRQFILKILFLVANGIGILLNVIDIGFYKFSGKRTTASIFDIMSYGNDFINTVPRMIFDFWYLTLILVALFYLQLRLYNRVKINSQSEKKSGKGIFIFVIQYLLLLALLVIGARGGIQLKPLKIISAAGFTSTANEAALVLNTPFTVIKSFGKTNLKEVNYFTAGKATEISPVIKSYPASNGRKQNVVLIILEGFGKEYIGALNHYKGYTPFLDSLISKSLICTNAFANGKSSIDGIPAVIAGIPSLMGQPYITSEYNANNISSAANLLSNEGYSTAFFHGGTNGTMNFDIFSKIAGYSKYYGRTEYNNDKDYDGNWGIFDEPFLQFTATKISGMKQPFLATVFTLSSHQPYAIPKQFKGKFLKGTLPIHESIQYADYSLKHFFETCKRMPWYDSTLFVITADHTSLSEYAVYQTKAGLYAVPIIFFSPSENLTGIYTKICQQIDITPSILHYTGYSKPFFAFGSSIFDEQAPHFSMTNMNDAYQLIYKDFLLTFNGQESVSLYNLNEDSLMLTNLLITKREIAHELEMKIKSLIQNYNYAILRNKMTAN